jgi:predicted molibdopterin-dependent oxidoreductase YjgC
MLRAATEGRLVALVLVGCDPLSDFPDRGLARDALERVGFLASVDLFLTDSSSRAQVVLPATGAGEKAGTTTNLEGRVSRLGRKATPPGTARQDWMIAVELADRLGADLGVESMADIWAEIEQLASAHTGLTPDLLAQPAHASGLVIPLTPDGLASRPERFPQETGAVGQGATVIGNPPSISPYWTRVPPGELPTRATQTAATPHEVRSTPPVTPGRVARANEGPVTSDLPAWDRQSAEGAILRLVSGRKLYDAGVGVQRSPSLASLAPPRWVGVNPGSLDRLGLRDGDDVMVTARRGQLEMPVRADPDLAEGCAWVPFNQPGGGAADLIDAAADFTAVVLGPPSRPAR